MLSGHELIRFEEEFGGAAEAVARALPGVTQRIEWDHSFETDGLNLEFLAPRNELICMVVFNEVNSSDRNALDRWMRGTIGFNPDGAPGDPDPAIQCVPDLWRVAVLEELAAAIRWRRPKGAAHLRRVAEFLRPMDVPCATPGRGSH